MQNRKMMLWILFYTLLFLLGAFLAYSSYNHYSKTKRMLKEGIRTTAKVAKFDTHSSDNSTMYTPIFEFKDRSQNIQHFKSGISSSPPAYKIGGKVKIIYSKNNPSNVKTISFWGLYRWSVILFMIASPLLVIGGSYLLYHAGL